VIGALTFLTVLGPRRHSQQPGSSGFAWFWLVGGGIGFILAGVWLALSAVAGPGVAALIVVTVDLALTGMLHFDGLADSADGLIAPMDRQRRLEIMRKPDIGAFGVCVLVICLMGRWVGLQEGGFNPLILVAVWSMSRAIAATIPGFVSYARSDGGLASAFLPGATRWLGLSLIPAIVLALATNPIVGAVSIVALMAGALSVLVLARHQIGGFTGDVLGAVIVVSETAALLAAAGASGANQ